LCILDYHDNSIKVSFDNSTGSKFGTIEGGVNLPFEKGEVWFTVGARIRYSSVWGEITHTSGPDFYLVECIYNSDCITNSICNITDHTCTDDECSYSITDFDYYADSNYNTINSNPSYTFGETIYIKWNADLPINCTTYEWQIMTADGGTSITEPCNSSEDGADSYTYINIYGLCLDSNTGECDTVKLEAGTYNIKITYNNTNCDPGSYTTSSKSNNQFTVIDNTDYGDFGKCTIFEPGSYEATVNDFKYQNYSNSDYYCYLVPNCRINDGTNSIHDSIEGKEYDQYCIKDGNENSDKTYVIYWTCTGLNENFNLTYNPTEVYFYMNIYCQYLENVVTGDTNEIVQTITITNEDYLESGCKYDGDNVNIYSCDIGTYLNYGSVLYYIIIKTVVKINGQYYISYIQENLHTCNTYTNGFKLQVFEEDTVLSVSNLIYNQKDKTPVYKNGDILNVGYDYSIYNDLTTGALPGDGYSCNPDEINAPIRYDFSLMNYDDTQVVGVNGVCESYTGTTNPTFSFYISILDRINDICIYGNSDWDPNAGNGSLGSDFPVYLKAGNKYYFKTLTSWNYCEDSKVTTTIFKDNYFTVECSENIDCDGNSDGNICDNNSCVICSSTEGCSKPQSSTLLETDSYARMAYEVNCSYTDDISKCMSKQGYPNFDQREIPMTCQVDSKTNKNVCAREECPPMSTPYTTDGKNFAAGCITPLNTNYNPDDDYNYSFNTQPSNTAVSYQSTNYGDIDYGYPFIAIIEGGTSDTISKPVYNDNSMIGLTSQKIAVPGMTNGNKVILMPVALQNFHPFIAWRTFGAINSLTNMVPWFLYLLENNNKMYSLYHIGSLKYLDTNTKTCTTSDGTGLSCQLTLKNLTDIKSYIPDNPDHPYICKSQPPTGGSDINACTTSSIWLNNVDANFDRKYNSSNSTVYIDQTAPIPGTEISTSSNNWNTPIGRNQAMVFFGDKTDTGGSLYYKNDSSNGNAISHMRRWYIGDKKDTNSYFWKSGLGKVPAGNAPSIDHVYKVLAEQWPNGPPYSPPTDRGTKVINFSAPIQYGIVPSYKQTNFYLEAYSWDPNYKTFKGLGFISNNTDPSSQGYGDGEGFLGMLSTNISKWTNIAGGSITNMYTIYNIHKTNNTYYMRYYTVDETNKSYTSSTKNIRFKFSADARYTMDIIISSNGYIFGIIQNLGGSRCLCVSNKDNNLYWVLTDAKLDSQEIDPNFTPIMLAMSWPS
jgi:hypothetical protein